MSKSRYVVLCPKHFHDVGSAAEKKGHQYGPENKGEEDEGAPIVVHDALLSVAIRLFHRPAWKSTLLAM